MDRNELARQMRERALLIASDENLDERSLRNHAELRAAKSDKLARVEELKSVRRSPHQSPALPVSSRYPLSSTL